MTSKIYGLIEMDKFEKSAVYRKLLKPAEMCLYMESHILFF